MFEPLIAETASRLNLSSASVSTLVRELLGMMTEGRAGGLEGFLDRFQGAGLGDTARSWFGGSEKRAITETQVESVLSPRMLSSLVTSSGLPRTTVVSAAAVLLPSLIGVLTPHGRLPSHAAMLSRVSSYLDRPDPAALLSADHRPMPGWLPWAGVALLALVGWLAL